MERNYANSTQSNSESTQDKFLKEEAYLRAVKRVKEIRGFYTHLVVYLLVNIFLIGAMGYFSGFVYVWPFGIFSPAFFWGLGLAFHALKVFGAKWIFGKQWEDRKIKEYMEEDERKH